jgi:TonB family protein
MQGSLPPLFIKCRQDRLTFENMLDDYLSHFNLPGNFDWLRGNSIAGAFYDCDQFSGYGSEDKTETEEEYLALWRAICERGDVLDDLPDDDIEKLSFSIFFLIYYIAGSVARGSQKLEDLQKFLENMERTILSYVEDGGDPQSLIYKRLIKEKDELTSRCKAAAAAPPPVQSAERPVDETEPKPATANVNFPTSYNTVARKGRGSRSRMIFALVAVGGVLALGLFQIVTNRQQKLTSQFPPGMIAFPNPVTENLPSGPSASKVNIRGGPGPQFASQEILTPGASVTELGRAFDEDRKAWLVIRKGDGTFGYIKERLVHPQAMESSIAPNGASLSNEPLSEIAPMGETSNAKPAMSGDQIGSPSAKQVAALPHYVTSATLQSAPTAADMAHFYPPAAKQSGIAGQATITCSVNVDGKLENCSVSFETPSGQGFGQAALALADTFKMRPALADGVPVAGGHYTARIRFAQ